MSQLWNLFDLLEWYFGIGQGPTSIHRFLQMRSRFELKLSSLRCLLTLDILGGFLENGNKHVYNNKWKQKQKQIQQKIWIRRIPLKSNETLSLKS